MPGVELYVPLCSGLGICARIPAAWLCRCQCKAPAQQLLTGASATCWVQIQKIVRSIPPQRQTLFFSATWPREVKSIASQFVTHNTVHVFVGGVEEKLVANKAITQFVEIMDSYSKMNRLGQVRWCNTCPHAHGCAFVVAQCF